MHKRGLSIVIIAAVAAAFLIVGSTMSTIKQIDNDSVIAAPNNPNAGKKAKVPTLTLSANPLTISSGKTSTLTWSSSNATSCTASGGWTGTKLLSGTYVTPALSVSTSFSLTCTNSVGSVTKSVTVTVSAGDTTAPSAPTNLKVTNTTSNSVSVSWTASTDNVAVVGYKILRNNVVITTLTGTSYTDAGLSPSTNYTYAVSAFDAAGNTSAVSVSTTGQTLAATVTPPPTGSGPIIVPGSGFTSITAQPAKRGVGYAVDSTAIAHWDTVPFQTFSNTINVAVVAFHANDIEKVSFSANGGPWSDVTSMTSNPETGVVEYWATLRASDFPDGQLEVRAIAYPKIGVPKVLQGIEVMTETSSLLLNANSRQTLAHKVRYVSKTGDDANDCLTAATSCATIKRAMDVATSWDALATNDGAEIRLGEGIWILPSMSAFARSKQWLTVTSAPGTNPDNVQINGMSGGYGMGMELLKVTNVAITDYISSSPTIYQGLHPQVWLDKAYFHFLDPNYLCVGNTNSFSYPTGWNGAAGIWTGQYFTDVHIYNAPYGPQGTLVRNVYAERTSGAHASGSATLINYSVKTADGGGFTYPSGCKSGDVHGDVYQMYGRTSDTILYGIKIIPGGWINSTRGVVGGEPNIYKDNAFVNVDLTGMGGWVFSFCAGTYSGRQYVIDHMVIKNSTFIGAVDWCGENSAMVPDVNLIKNSMFENSLFGTSVPQPSVSPGIRYINSGGINTSWDTVTNMPVSYTITATAGSNGSITPSGTVTYINTGAVTYKIIPNPNYQVEDVKVDGVSQGAIYNYTFQTVSANHTISATFKPFQSITNAPTSGLVGYWALNDNTGTSAIDGSGNGNTGTLASGATWTNGKFGPAVHFDGSAGYFGSYINLGKTGANNLPTSVPITISAWVNYPVGGSGVIVGGSDYGSGAFDFELKSNSFCAAGTNGNGCVTVSNPPTSGWHHIVGVGTNTQLTMYVDNVPTTSTTFNPYGSHGGATGINVSIAANWNGTPQTASGDVDEVRIYNRALSTSEVGQLYAPVLATKNISAHDMLASVATAVWQGAISKVGEALSGLVFWK